jgi:hypothetical protein
MRTHAPGRPETGVCAGGPIRSHDTTPLARNGALSIGIRLS